MGVHTGVNAANEPGFRFDNIRITPQNLAFNVNDAIAPGLRNEGLVEFSAIAGTDIAERGVSYQHEAKVTFKTFQCKPLFLRNYTALSRILVDAQMKAIGGGSASIGWLTFINNAAAFGVQATGTTSMAFGYKFMLNSTEATAQITLNSYLTSLLTTDEFQLLLSSSGAALAANTGGTTQGLTAQAYAYSSKLIPIWDSLQITNSGGAALVGKLGMNSEFGWETFTGEPDTRNRGIAQGLKLGGKFHIIDANQTQWRAFLTDYAEDITMTAKDKNGYTYIISAGAGTGHAAFRLSEKPKDSHVELEVKGDVPMNPGVISDVTYMDIGTTSPTTIQFNLAGYN